MDGVKECRECGSADLFWFAVNVNKSGVAEGRLRTHEVTCRFVLGCHECSETMATVDADRVAERMNTDQSELAALREELADISSYNDKLNAQCESLQQRLTAAEQRNAIREDLLNKCMHAFNHVVGFSEQATRNAWYENFLKPVSGAIMVHLSECAKPTESGASE